MEEGKILLAYIENQRKAKATIAKELGMSRRNLYQLFDSQNLAPDTKEKFEKYFKEKIFTVNTHANNHNGVVSIPSVSMAPDKSAYVELLKAQIKTLENHCSFLQKAYEDAIKEIRANLKESLSNQSVMMRQIAVLTDYEAVEHSAQDKKKLQEDRNKISKQIDAVKR